jgi:hypothetical protein
MKKILLLLTVIASLTIANAQAGLGWTLDECKQHYGEALPFDVKPYAGRVEYAFHAKGFDILVFILNGKVSRVAYLGESALDLGQIHNLLVSNAPGVVWDGPIKDPVSNGFRYIGTKEGSSDVVYWAQSGKSDDRDFIAIWNAEDNKAVKEQTAKDASGL